MRSGLIGALFGGFFWMVLLGMLLGDVVPIACGAAGFSIGALVGLRLLKRNRRVVTGGAMLWIVAWAAPVVALYWERIPESVGPLTTGKSPWLVGAVLLAVALSGVSMIWRGLYSSGG